MLKQLRLTCFPQTRCAVAAQQFCLQAIDNLRSDRRRALIGGMGTKSRETIYGGSVRASAERAAEARKEADRLACEAWNKRMLAFQGPAQPSPALGDALNAGGRVSGLPRASRPQRRCRARSDDDALGHAATASDGWSAGHQHPQHVLAALASVAEAGEPVPGRGEQFRRLCARAQPRDQEGRRLVRLER
jgi:hypothetical protein